MSPRHPCGESLCQRKCFFSLWFLCFFAANCFFQAEWFAGEMCNEHPALNDFGNVATYIIPLAAESCGCRAALTRPIGSNIGQGESSAYTDSEIGQRRWRLRWFLGAL